MCNICATCECLLLSRIFSPLVQLISQEYCYGEDLEGEYRHSIQKEIYGENSENESPRHVPGT